MIEEGLVTLLTATGSGDAIDTYVSGKVFGDSAPPDQGQMPCLCYVLVGGSSEPTLNSSGVIRQRVELNAMAMTAVGGVRPDTIARKLRAAVIARVNGWQQSDVGGDGTNVLNTVLLNPGTDFVTEERVFRCMCEFYVLYTLPTN